MEEFCTLLTEESNTTSGRITEDESPSTRGENLSRLYHFAATDKLAPVEQQQLRTLRKIAREYYYNNVACMPALCAVLEANAEAMGCKSWELPELTPLLQYSDRSEMVARARPSNALLSKEEMIRLTIQNKHHLWNADYKPLKGYRDLHEIFREQMRAVAAGGEYHTEGRTVRLLSAPLPARQLTYSETGLIVLFLPWISPGASTIPALMTARLRNTVKLAKRENPPENLLPPTLFVMNRCGRSRAISWIPWMRRARR